MSYNAWEAEAQEAKARSLADRWSELSRKLRLDIEIQVRRIETLISFRYTAWLRTWH